MVVLINCSAPEKWRNVYDVGKKIPSSSFFLFFSFRKERRLNSVSLFRMAGALRGSLHRCTFCKGPETPQGRLRSSWKDGSGEQLGRWQLAQQQSWQRAAAPATHGKTSSRAQRGRTRVGIRARAGLAANGTHPL